MSLFISYTEQIDKQIKEMEARKQVLDARANQAKLEADECAFQLQRLKQHQHEAAQLERFRQAALRGTGLRITDAGQLGNVST